MRAWFVLAAGAAAVACDGGGEPCDTEGAVQCDGDTLHYCDLGQPATVDCRAAGYSGCATQSLGDRTIALCSP